MKPDNILLTGLRLAAILKMLYEKELNKNEIKQILKDEYAIDEISNETIKLDINTLISRGFKIKRGSGVNCYRYTLDKDFSFLKLNYIETMYFSLIKNMALAACNFKDILYLREFYNKIRLIFDDDYIDDVLDFKYFDSLNMKLIKKAEYAIKTKSKVFITYNSKDVKRTHTVYINKIAYRGQKVHFDCMLQETGKVLTFRADKTDSIEIEKENGNYEFQPVENKFIYKIKKEFYKNNPLANFESIIKEDNETVEIEACIDNKFFVIQRILSLGKNCVEIKDKQIKDELLKTIECTKGIYT